MVQNPISAGSHNLMKVAEHGSCRVCLNPIQSSKKKKKPNMAYD